MENQQTEMIHLHEVAACEKEEATCVQITQTDQSTTGVTIFFHCGKKPTSPPSPTRTQKSVYSTESSRSIQSETYEDAEDSEDTRHS